MKMKIIAGDLGGRLFDAPDSKATHPMSERVRGALFNIIGNIQNKNILDPFAGSGALGLEALSRGASFCTFLDIDRKAHLVVKNNVSILMLEERSKVIRAGASSWSDNNQDQKFDVILCDPPYNKIQLSTISKLSGHLHPKGLMVLSHPGRGNKVPVVNGVVVVDNRNYGDAALSFYQPK